MLTISKFNRKDNRQELHGEKISNSLFKIVSKNYELGKL